MKFAQNRMYIESYNKCPNCGVLIYEKPANASISPVISMGKTYCSDWCVDWQEKRNNKRAVKASI